VSARPDHQPDRGRPNRSPDRAGTSTGPTVVRTVAGHVRAETARVKGSRFLADLAPAADEAAAMAVVTSVRGREPDASHHCWAFRLSTGLARSHDDGEPGGTAGPPILRHLRGADLSDVVCVVTRWFGGTKLGTGGLVRAYGNATAAVIDVAEVVVRPVRARFSLDHPHDLTGPVEAVLAAHDATTVDAAWDVAVHLEVTVPLAVADAFAAAMRDATSGRVVPRRHDPGQARSG
jgi:uncharacterized YigZ family protein